MNQNQDELEAAALQEQEAAAQAELELKMQEEAKLEAERQAELQVAANAEFIKNNPAPVEETVVEAPKSIYQISTLSGRECKPCAFTFGGEVLTPREAARIHEGSVAHDFPFDTEDVE